MKLGMNWFLKKSKEMEEKKEYSCFICGEKGYFFFNCFNKD